MAERKYNSKGPYPGYEPNPNDIRKGCQEIQETWSEPERKRRAGIDPLARLTVPEISDILFMQAVSSTLKDSENCTSRDDN